MNEIPPGGVSHNAGGKGVTSPSGPLSLRGEGEVVVSEIDPRINRGRRETASPAVWENLKPRAQEMRRAPTDAEDALWSKLRQRPGGFKFRRQHAITTYIVDFYCVAAQLVIELDGSIHDHQVLEDQERQERLETLGLKVLRFKNDDVLANLPDTIDKIIAVCHEQTPELTPSPRKERGQGVR